MRIHRIRDRFAATEEILAPHASVLGGEVAALIREHHKMGVYRGPFATTVETFRRADYVDVSLGILRFGLPWSFVREVQAAHPDAGFHWRLATLTAAQFLRSPLRPLPMFHR